VKGSLVHSGLSHLGVPIATWRGEWLLLNPYTNRLFRACECEVEESTTGQTISFHTGAVHVAAEYLIPLGVCMVLEEQPA
jgi:hypothetical protein